MGFKVKRGFTLVELVLVMVIIMALSVCGSYVFFFLVQNGIYIPQQLNTDMLLSGALNVMVEGSAATTGLRSSRSISEALGNQVSFYSQNNELIRFRLNTATGQMLQSINNGAETALGGYLPAGVTFRGKSGRVFQYFDVNETVTTVPTAVRRIEISLIAVTGSGNFADWEGQSEMVTAVTVRPY